VMESPPNGMHLAGDTILRSAKGLVTVGVLIAGDLCVAGEQSLPAEGEPVPWAPLVSAVRAHDLALVNLECPLTERRRAIRKSGPSLRGDPALARVVASGGFGAVTLANNHMLDAGPAGLEDTLTACSRAGLMAVGAGLDLASAEKPLQVDVRGMRVRVIACAEREFSIAGPSSPGAAPLDPWKTPELVNDATRSADVVVVVVHGGNEFAAVPRPGLVAACRALVAAGAHAVVCHHAHVAGPVEVYRGAPIFYGTGNFLFPSSSAMGQAWHLGYAVSLQLTVGGVSSFQLLPYEQGVAGLTVRQLGEREEKAFAARLLQAAAVVADPELLAAAWEEHCEDQRRYYLHAALGLTRVERRLLRQRIWPAWRRPRRRAGKRGALRRSCGWACWATRREIARSP